MGIKHRARVCALQKKAWDQVKAFQGVDFCWHGIRHTKQNECDAEQQKLAELQTKLERRLLELEQEGQCQHDLLVADFDQVGVILVWHWSVLLSSLADLKAKES
jgi:hypothetical protein